MQQIILLPGMDGTGRLYKPLLKEIGGRYKVKVVSYPKNEPLTYTELTAFVRSQLVDDVEYVIVAESFSGKVACLLAEDNSINIRNIIFIASFLTSPNKYMKYIPNWLLKFLFSAYVPSVIARSCLFDASVRKSLVNEFRDIIRSANKAVLAFRFCEMASLRSDTETVLIPALYIRAKYDKLIKSIHVEDFRRKFNKFDLVEIEGPHFLAQSEPEKCWKIISDHAQI